MTALAPAYSHWVWALLALVTLWRLWAAWALPVTQDEAYYFDWARSLAWGYFDHPPGVALLGSGIHLANQSALAGRLGTVLAATLTLLALLRFYRSCGLHRADLLAAVVVASTTLPGIASGVLTTPDTALALGWALALNEALAALRGQHVRWLSAGMVTGLGLLGKYTMVLIGPVLLWAILWADPKTLRTRWPYLGALMALLIFAPHIIWNAEHDWVTMRFQFGHGFATETGNLVTDTLPAAGGVPHVESVTSSEERSATEMLGAVLGFVGIQAALWGLLILPLFAGLLRRLAGRRATDLTLFDRPARALLITGTAVPLVFFAALASFADVEPNWPAMYLMAAAPLAAVAMRRLGRWVLVAAGGNLLLASLLVYHGATGGLPMPEGLQRILRETHGYRALAQQVADLPGLVFADRYQIVAMLRFYAPSLDATQWPGITRPSEYLRGQIAAPVSLETVREAGGFWLVTRWASPPDIPGFIVRSQDILFDCGTDALVEVAENAPAPCRRPLQRWALYAYETDPAK